MVVTDHCAMARLTLRVPPLLAHVQPRTLRGGVTRHGFASLVGYSTRDRGEAGVWLSHERLSYNYHMDELLAALGVAQMSRIEEIIVKRERVAAMHAERLARVQGVCRGCACRMWRPR
ncbi:MAG: DegT/DnrJ/EryC1/StrS family aminotransferase [Firmicutes bacterium]|jgi:perosamine synthetase|nr:DegT/DnrJ/EryC1/StrS family aminotransferase [Bacillota bacterium]